MRSFRLTLTSTLLPCILPLISAAYVSNCPANARNFTTDDGKVYEHCPYSDFQVYSSQVVPKVTTAFDCIQLCNGNAACTQAVWDPLYYYCHIKGQTGTRSASRQFDTIQYVTTGPKPVSGLTSCPTTPQSYEAASGAVYEICPNSDYSGASNIVKWGVADRPACAEMCSSTPGCTLGVWDKLENACHVKSNSVTWVNVSTKFDTIRLIAPPAPQPIPTGLTACPQQPARYTLDDGSVYEVCANTDYQAGSYSVLPNILSDWDCLRLCNLDTTCTLTVYDYGAQYCHFKSLNGINWANSTKFNSARLIKQGTRSTNSTSPNLGRWGTPIVLPANPVGAYIIPGTTRILAFSSWGDNNFWGPSGYTQFSDFNWQNGQFSARTVSNTQHDMFCPGISAMADGRIIVTGGEDAGKASIYDPASNAFTSGANMNIPRGYQTSTTLDSGKVFTIGGSFSGGRDGKTGEVYDPAANTWTVLPGTNVTAAYTTYDGEGNWRYDNHMWLWAWKQGSIFQAGPSRTQHWYGTTGTGNTTFSGTRDPNADAMCGVHAMYDAVHGKIWSAGGAQSYTNSPGLTTAHITTLGQPFAPATVKQVAPLPRARDFANVAVLPDGTLLVTGGQAYAHVFQDNDSQFIADLYNPVADTWKSLASSRIPRNYHSISLLLADGRVLVGGGGLCWTANGQSDAGCDRHADHPSVEIFSPPYLFNADGSWATRPNINTVSSTSDGSGASAKAGDVLKVAVDSGSATLQFALLRTGGVTHTVNTDQRRVPLTGTKNGGSWSLQVPSDYGIVVPGSYYLFVVDGNGVPSFARTITIKR